MSNAHEPVHRRWPGLIEAYRDRLRDMHEHIEREGSFKATTTRFLIEARKPR